MKRNSMLFLLLISSAGLFILRFYSAKAIVPEKKAEQKKEVLSVSIKQATSTASTKTIDPIYQTFNNCGPASLSMILEWNGIHKNQEELADILRPYRNPQGDNDDKSISTEEYVNTAQSFQLFSLNRPNGTLGLLKMFISNGIPVVVKSWLHPGEDIGHFRIITGYNDEEKKLYQVDSYQGSLSFDYDEFMAIWQPFNYEYMIVVNPDKKQLVESIIGREIDEKTVWSNALTRAQKEAQENGSNPYPLFNQAIAYYYLGNYSKTTDLFEKVETRLPKRMLWYQIEPIDAYQKIGNSQRVFALTDAILENHNRAFSELYLIRGVAYMDEGKLDNARAEFEKAVYYNKNFTKAKDALNQMM